VPGLCRERPPAAAAAGHGHLELSEEVPVDVGELLDAGGAGEGAEAGEVDAVGADGVRTAAAVEGLPIEVLVDGPDWMRAETAGRRSGGPPYPTEGVSVLPMVGPIRNAATIRVRARVRPRL
jgi:hypothetical protein